MALCIFSCATKDYAKSVSYESLKTRNKLHGLDVFPAYLLPRFVFIFLHSTEEKHYHVLNNCMSFISHHDAEM